MGKTHEQEPIKEKTYRGIQGIEISTSGWLGREPQLYYLINKLNKERPKDDQIGIEIYPTNLIVTPYNIKEWEKEYPKAKTTRIHLPFHYNLSENLLGIIKEKKFSEKFYCLIWLGIFGVAKNEKAVRIAQQLGLEVNMHPNVAEGFALEGKLQEIKQNVPATFVENQRPYSSNIVKDQRKIFDPLVIKDLINEYQLTGLILDTEHLKKEWFSGVKSYEKGVSPISSLEKTKDVLAKIHISGEKGNHGLLQKDDPLFNSILAKVSQMEFNHPLKIVFDFSPLPLLTMRSQKKLEIIQTLTDKINTYRLL